MTRILVVEDQPDLRKDLEWAASGPGREVVTAQSAKEGMQKIADEDFEVVVTDLQMETEEAGLSVLKAAKEKDIYIQVIVCTVYATKQISVKTMRLGAFDYLDRTAHGTDFLEMVRSKIGLALEFREAKLK